MRVQTHSVTSRAQDEQSSSALYGPDPLEPVRDAIIRRDPGDFVQCFTPDAVLRVPRREGDIVIQGHDDLGRAAGDLQSLIRELSWTPSRRLVSAGEVTEEAVVVVHQNQRQHQNQHRNEHRNSRSATPPPPGSEEAVRVPLRVVAATESNGLISSLTLWLDWAALLDPQGITSAGGAASALVAVARSRDDRGLRVLQTPAVPVITPRPPEPENEEADPDRPEPMSRSAIWWELHRRTVAGGTMALIAALLLGWVGLHVLDPLRNTNSSSAAAAADEDTLLGADTGNRLRGASSSATGAASESGGTDTQAGDAREGDPSDAASSASSSNPQATGAGPGGSGAPVMSSQKPDVRPTVQAGKEITFLSDVLFRFGSFDLSKRSQTRLDRLAEQIRESGVQGDIQVNGYTDSIGSTADNMELSDQRALAVARALSLRLNGVDVRLQVQAFGEGSPRDTNTTDEGRRQNRRVAVVLPEST